MVFLVFKMYKNNKKSPKKGIFGGELGIRTPDSFHYASFQDWCIQPLYQLSIFSFFVSVG